MHELVGTLLNSIADGTGEPPIQLGVSLSCRIETEIRYGSSTCAPTHGTRTSWVI